MKHQYKTEILWKKRIQSFIDFFIDIYSKLFIKKDVYTQDSNPKKILFVTLAQLGDALVESYVFPFIHERYPNAQIDVLTSDWCKPILENNPYVSNIFYFNHFRMNRSEKKLRKKILSHLKSSRIALQTIRSQKYDLSIEGGVTHPNGNILCYRGGIKRRIGFGSGGFGSLLTDEVLFPMRSGFHILEAVLGELKKLGIEKKLEEIKPYFFISKKRTSKDHPFASYFKDTFIIVHPESGNVKRMLSKEFWQVVIYKILNLTDYKIIICGTSNKTIELIEFLLYNISNVNARLINAVQKLSIDEFFILSEFAKAAITTESLPAHLCAISCETLSFYKNGSGTFFFPIPNKRATIIHNHLPSRNVEIHTKIASYFVNNVESEETFILVEKFVNDLTKRKNF